MITGYPKAIISGLIGQIITKLNTGLNLVNGGTAVSSSNPLPIVQPVAAAINIDSINGLTNNVRALNTAVPAQFARQQIHNAGSTSIQVNALTVWAATAGTHVYSVYEVTTHDASTKIANAKTCFRLGDAGGASIEVYNYASATAIQTTGILGSNTSAVIVTPGSSLLFGAGAITIPAGKTLEIAIGTANVAFTINATVLILPV